MMFVGAGVSVCTLHGKSCSIAASLRENPERYESDQSDYAGILFW